eukprot:7954991-Lingulodinium_polyedra.AAC.1
MVTRHSWEEPSDEEPWHAGPLWEDPDSQESGSEAEAATTAADEFLDKLLALYYASAISAGAACT